MQKLCSIALIWAIVFLVPSATIARPVSYPGGWTVMQYNEAKNSSLLIHYTIDPKTSLGFRAEDRNYGDHFFIGGQINRLIKRWNAPASQANIYLKTGLGLAHGGFNEPESDTTAAGFARVSGDWENRRWFTSGDLYVYSTKGQTFTGQQIRLGVAPYVADFGALHTWLMLQAEWKQNPLEVQSEEDFTLTPLIRLFKGSTLLELGYSTNNEPLVNFIYRFYN